MDSFGARCSLVLAFFISVRIALSFIPCEAGGVSGYLCAVPALRRSGEEVRTFTTSYAIPEGARVANRRDYLTFRHEAFTVDQHGFRNGPGNAATKPRVVLVGSSFNLGLALSDDETLTARLNQRLGPVVYNASGIFSSATPATLPNLNAAKMMESASQSGMAKGWILLEVLNRETFAYVTPDRATAWSGSLRERVTATVLGGEARSLITKISRPPALMMMASLINMRLHDGKLLPNPFRNQYLEEELATGDRMLVYSEDEAFSRKPGSAEATAKAILALRDELNDHGYRLAVMLQPTSYSVYAPLYPAHRGESDSSKEYMDGIEERLKTGGVPRLNLLPVLRAAAAKALAGGGMIYYKDDAHWNPAGTEAAAAAVAPWLANLLDGQMPNEVPISVPRAPSPLR